MTKPRKPFTRSATKKQNPVDENHVEEDPFDEDPVDQIPTDEMFRCLEFNNAVEDKPPLDKKVRFIPKILSKEKLGRHVTRSSARKHIQVEETKSETHIHCLVEELVEV